MRDHDISQRTARWFSLPKLDVPPPDTRLPWLNAPIPRFAKGDSRLANMVVSQDGKLGCVDFKFAGLRHGSEDLATLLCNETMPVDIAPHITRLEMLIHTRAPADPSTWFKTFCVDAALQAGTRLRVIAGDVQKRGWGRYEDILIHDLVGAHPVLMTRLARRGALFAEMHRETRSLVASYTAIAAQIAEAGPRPDT